MPETELEAACTRMLDALLEGAPGAQAEVKELVFLCENRPIDEALGEETSARIAARRASTEGREGVDAFFGRRAPGWRPAYNT